MFKRLAEFLGFAKFLVGLINPIQEFMKAVELPGFGPQKKEAVLALVKELLKTAELVIPGIKIPEDVIINFAGNIIDLLVAFYNLTGVFKHVGGPMEKIA